MKQLILLVCFLFTIVGQVGAITIDEIRNNPERFLLKYTSDESDIYLDLQSVNVVRYAPPFYTINIMGYTVSYGILPLIVEDNISFSYNWDNKEVECYFTILRNYEWNGKESEYKNPISNKWKIEKNTGGMSLARMVFRRAYGIDFLEE